MDVITTFKIMNDLEDSIGHVNEDTINGNRLDHFEKTDEIENKVSCF